jgi:hypothetical protein
MANCSDREVDGCLNSKARCSDREVDGCLTSCPIRIGDKVAYAARWVRSTGHQTGDVPFLRGTVTELKPLGDRTLGTVDWNDGE